MYLVIPKVKIRIAGYFHLNNNPKRVPYLTINGAIIVEWKVLKHIVLSLVETETAGVFYNA